jgi:hypothetical protein
MFPAARWHWCHRTHPATNSHSPLRDGSASVLRDGPSRRRMAAHADTHAQNNRTSLFVRNLTSTTDSFFAGGDDKPASDGRNTNPCTSFIRKHRGPPATAAGFATSSSALVSSCCMSTSSSSRLSSRRQSMCARGAGDLSAVHWVPVRVLCTPRVRCHHHGWGYPSSTSLTAGCNTRTHCALITDHFQEFRTPTDIVTQFAIICVQCDAE